MKSRSDFISGASRRLLGGTARRGGLKTMAGGSAGALVGLAALPILTRLYGPTEFGGYGVFLALVYLATRVATLQLELAIPIAKNDEELSRLLALLTSVCVFLAAATAVALYVCGQLALELAQVRIFPGSATGAIFIGVVELSGLQIATMYALRRRYYNVLALVPIARSGFQVAAQLGLSMVGWKEGVLVWGHVLGTSIALLVIAGFIVIQGEGNLPPLKVRGSWRVFVRYKRFALYSAPASLLNTGALQLPVLLLAALFGPEAAGYFAVAQRVTGLPARILVAAAGNVFLAESARGKRETPEAIRLVFDKAVRLLMIIALVAGAGLFVAGPFAVGSLFGEAWKAAGRFVQALVPATVGQLCVSPISQVTAVLERQDLQLIGDTARACVIVTVFLVTDLIGASPLLAVTAYSLTISLTYFMFLRIYSNLIPQRGMLKQDVSCQESRRVR